MIDALVQLLAAIGGRLLGYFRQWLDRQPDPDSSQLPWWHRLARLTLAIAVSLAILIPLGWLIWR